MSEHVLPALVALSLRSLREALVTLKATVGCRSPLDEVRAELGHASQLASELARLVPDVAVLTAERGMARHLAWAASMIEHNEYPDQDVTDLVGRDLDELIAKIRAHPQQPEGASELRRALGALEGPGVEFIEAFPPSAQARDLGKEIAALAPSGGGIYLGVNDRGHVVGLPITSRTEVDDFELRVRGIAEKVVDPPVPFNAHWLAVEDAIVLAIEIPPSGEPFHCIEGRPYIRAGSASRVARQVEIIRVVREHESRQAALRGSPSATDFRVGQDFEVWPGDDAAAYVRAISVEPIPWSSGCVVNFGPLEPGEEVSRPAAEVLGLQPDVLVRLSIAVVQDVQVTLEEEMKGERSKKQGVRRMVDAFTQGDGPGLESTVFWLYGANRQLQIVVRNPGAYRLQQANVGFPGWRFETRPVKEPKDPIVRAITRGWT